MSRPPRPSSASEPGSGVTTTSSTRFWSVDVAPVATMRSHNASLVEPVSPVERSSSMVPVTGVAPSVKGSSRPVDAMKVAPMEASVAPSAALPTVPPRQSSKATPEKPRLLRSRARR